MSDVVGYSRLAGADEDRILARLRTLRSDLIDRAVRLDGEGAAALRLIIEMEVFARSPSDAKMAALARAATELGRDREAIRRVAKTIIDALDADAGPVTLSKIERRIAERRT